MPVKMRLTLQVANHAIDDPPAEALARGFRHWWAARLHPVEEEASVGLMRPFQRNPAFCRR